MVIGLGVDEHGSQWANRPRHTQSPRLGIGPQSAARGRAGPFSGPGVGQVAVVTAIVRGRVAAQLAADRQRRPNWLVGDLPLS